MNYYHIRTYTPFCGEEYNKLNAKYGKFAILGNHDYYQKDEIQAISDYVGDSYQLSKIAKDSDADILVLKNAISNVDELTEVIGNYYNSLDLGKELGEYNYLSETDSEVVAALINKLYEEKKDMLEVLKEYFNSF